MVQENKFILVKCARCLRATSLDQMKFAKDGKTMICSQCYGSPLRSATTKESAPRASGVKNEYYCTACNYSFKRSNIKPEKCPYCGKPNIREKGTLSSHALLESDDF